MMGIGSLNRSYVTNHVYGIARVGAQFIAPDIALGRWQQRQEGRDESRPYARSD